MKPVLYSALAMICYALANVLIEQKLSRLNSLTIMVCYSSIIFITAFVFRLALKTNDRSFAFPAGNVFWITIGVGFLFALADYFFITAYTHGGKLFTVTAIFILFPIMGTLVKFFLTKEVPNWWQLCGYLFAVFAVLCIVKGSKNEMPHSLPP